MNMDVFLIHLLTILEHHPDGICDIDSVNKQYIGRMLEIKCPKSRPIGFIPEYYELQIQGQLEVYDLEYCDYLECSFIEFNSIDEFLSNLTDNIHFKGIIVEKFNITLEKVNTFTNM